MSRGKSLRWRLLRRPAKHRGRLNRKTLLWLLGAGDFAEEMLGGPARDFFLSIFSRNALSVYLPVVGVAHAVRGCAKVALDLPVEHSAMITLFLAGIALFFLRYEQYILTVVQVGIRLRICIQPGDTLVCIALRSGISVECLTEGNDLKDPDRIIDGQGLFLPSHECNDEQAIDGQGFPSASNGYEVFRPEQVPRGGM